MAPHSSAPEATAQKTPPLQMRYKFWVLDRFSGLDFSLVPISDVVLVLAMVCRGRAMEAEAESAVASYAEALYLLAASFELRRVGLEDARPEPEWELPLDLDPLRVVLRASSLPAWYARRPKIPNSANMGRPASA